jgi:hypothetical protein
MVGCNKSAPKPAKPPDEPPKDAAHQIAEAEDEFQSAFTVGGTYRAEARQAAVDLVKTQLSTWSIKGIASHEYKGQVYDVDVEIERKGKRLVLSFFVRKFFPESGEPYWQARLERGSLERRLEHIEDDGILKELNDAKDKINDLEKELGSKDSQREDE